MMNKSYLTFLCIIIGAVILVPLFNIRMIQVADDLIQSRSKGTSKNVVQYRAKGESASSLPEITVDDLIYKTRSAFVIPEYKLIFFTFPKVACSEWKRMFMRINGNPNWCLIRGFNAHDPQKNKIKVLKDYEPEIATAMMTSPLWTKAAIFREPKERVLSAFLDKAVKEDYYVKQCCNNLTDEKAKEKCIQNEKKFESFLYFVTEYPVECFNVHWEPQIAKIDSKWWPFLDIIGYQDNLQEDAQSILKQLYSSRDEIKGRSAWERYGVTGWGASNACENRTHSFLEENSSSHKLDTGSHLLEWYTPETEKIVEDKWAIEWSQERVKFKKVKLFPDHS